MIVLILLFSFTLLFPFEAVKSEVNRYLDLFLPYAYYDAIVSEKEGAVLNQEKMMKEVNAALNLYFASFDSVEQVRTYYSFEGLRVSFSLHYVYRFRPFRIAKEIVSDEKR